jgi:hypothetical protein
MSRRFPGVCIRASTSARPSCISTKHRAQGQASILSRYWWPRSHPGSAPPKHAFPGRSGRRTWKTADSGRTWIQVDPTLALSATVDPTTSSILYVAGDPSSGDRASFRALTAATHSSRHVMASRALAKAPAPVLCRSIRRIPASSSWDSKGWRLHLERCWCDLDECEHVPCKHRHPRASPWTSPRRRHSKSQPSLRSSRHEGHRSHGAANTC